VVEEKTFVPLLERGKDGDSNSLKIETLVV